MSDTIFAVGNLHIPTEYTAEEVKTALDEYEILDHTDDTEVHLDFGLDTGLPENKVTIYCNNESAGQLFIRSRNEEYLEENHQEVCDILLENDLVTKDEIENSTFKVVQTVTKDDFGVDLVRKEDN